MLDGAPRDLCRAALWSLTLVVTTTVSVAEAAVDVSGVWRVRLHSEAFSPDDFCTWALAQRGEGEVVGYQSGCLLPPNAGPITGTIDPASGVFHLFLDVQGDPACPTYTVDATLPPGGTSFTGTFDCPAFMLTGVIESVSRGGDGVVEAMEACDPGVPDTPGDCCTFDCQREAVSADARSEACAVARRFVPRRDTAA
jgi:hypothetical protein